jgi:DNA polymerase III subunit epsilon
VYIFEDTTGSPIYVGKSVHIKRRVASHFTRDHDNVQEFKLAQHVAHITTHTTAGELQALLLESQLVKQLQPLYNKQLRHTDKLLLAREIKNEDGYSTVQLEEASAVTIHDVPSILAIYARRSKARDSLERLVGDWDLCPKLLGLEKSKGACFQYQLHRCKGACVGGESPAGYNDRVQTAFASIRIEHWPFSGAVLIRETSDDARYGIIVDQWCVIAEVRQADEYSEPQITEHPRIFDLDSYKILQSFILRNVRGLSIKPINVVDQLASW